MDTKIALIALAVSLIALFQSFYFWRRSFRPIVTAMLKTVGSGNEAIAFDLVLLNSGSIPARNVTLHIHDKRELDAALDRGATSERRRGFLSCFDAKTVVPIIHNGAEVSCSFGFTSIKDSFWKQAAEFEVLVRYQGWFGRVYIENQTIKIVSSKSFTGFSWGA